MANEKDLKIWKKVMFPTMVQCQSCGQAMGINGLYQCTDTDQIQSMAEKTHSEIVVKGKIICANPKLTVIYSLGLTNA